MRSKTKAFYPFMCLNMWDNMTVSAESQLFHQRVTLTPHIGSISCATLEKIYSCLNDYVIGVVNKNICLLDAVIDSTATFESRAENVRRKKILHKHEYLHAILKVSPNRVDDISFRGVEVREREEHFSCLGILCRTRNIESDFLFLHEVVVDKHSFRVLRTRYL